jgi:hypothetical protein
VMFLLIRSSRDSPMVKYTCDIKKMHIYTHYLKKHGNLHDIMINAGEFRVVGH